MKWILEIPKCIYIYIYMYHTHIYVSYIIVSLSSKQMNMSTAAKIIPVCCYTKLRKIHHSEILFLCGLGKSSFGMAGTWTMAFLLIVEDPRKSHVSSNFAIKVLILTVHRTFRNGGNGDPTGSLGRLPS